MNDRPPLISELHPGNGPVTALEVSDGARQRVTTGDGPSRPWIYTNMVSSLDGAVARDGLSGALGNEADAAIFAALRSRCDAIIVGAGTAVAEQYRPAGTTHADTREARGQARTPRMVLVSGRLNIDPDLPVLHPPDDRLPPLVVTTEDAATRHNAQLLGPRVELIPVGSGSRLSAPDVMNALAEFGFEACLLEGGPSLNGHFAAADLIDEWNLTIAPTLIAASSGLRATAGDIVVPDAHFELSNLWLGGHHLFGRWIRSRR